MDALEKLGERGCELVDAFPFERGDDVGVVDTGLFELIEEASCLVQALREGLADAAVILEGADRLLAAWCRPSPDPIRPSTYITSA